MKQPRSRLHRQITRPIAALLAARRPSSLQVMFTLPVLVQIVAAVGLVGYLSFRNGQQAVEDLATQLRDEISARIQRELRSYFGAPHAINRLNAAAFTYGELDPVSAQTGENLLFQQMKIYPTIAFIYCGSARSGEFFGMLRSPDTGELQLSYSNGSNNFLRDYYSLDVRGSRLHHLGSSEERYDSRVRPWYQAAIEAEQPVWTEVYFAFTTGLPNVTAALPVYDERDRQLLGVCATDVVLPEEFRNFLASLKVGDSGQAYVIDRQGNLLSSSTDEPLMIRQGEETAVFLKAADSSNPLVSQSAQILQKRFGDFAQVRQGEQFIFDLAGQRQYLGVLPFNDGLGLDWLIVVVVPEADFMGQIRANTRLTILLCGIALAIALLIGIWSTRQVTRPILQLNAAVKDIAQGSWNRRVTLNRRDEVGQLGESVNQMAAQLQTSFAALERQKDAFARFFPPEYLRFLQKDSVTEIELGDHVSREMAVMFSDIRYFTSLAEKMDPQETFSFINAYLRQISPEIRAQNGFVVKFIGDGMMAVFPERVEDAVEAGIIQFQRVREYNAERQRQGQAPIEIGISIHVGHLMLGMIGEHNRIQGDALSDTVNLAARLEGITKVYGAALLISEAVRSQLPDPNRYPLRFLDRVIVKGRTEPIAIYEVLDADPEPTRHLKQATLATYEQGIAAYAASIGAEGPAHLETARGHFIQVLAINPGDRAARLYLERIHQLLAEGIPERWDGTWAFTHKG